MLTKPTRARERILLMGSFGSGKSNAWCTVAAWLRRTKSTGRVFVVDTDHAADRLAEGYDDFFNNVVAESVWDYPEAKAAIAKFRKSDPTSEDWLVVDLADKLWQYSQDYYIAEIFGKDAATYYMDAAREGVQGNPLSQEAYGVNWQRINQQYFSLMNDIQRWPGHILFCTPASPVQRANAQGKGGDDKDTVQIFGRYSVKPDGQKQLGFQFFTILWMIPHGNEEWRFTSVKDLNRERPQNAPMKDFVMDYLVGIAGWTL